jgi:hypothetical protein
MLRLMNFEEIQGMLFRVPALIDRHARRDARFGGEVVDWLAKLEKIMENNRMHQTAVIAAHRGTLIAAERGVTPPGVAMHGRGSRSKARDAAAVDILGKCSALVTELLQADVERFHEAERQMRQLHAFAAAKDLLPPAIPEEQRTEALQSLWRAMAADAELRGGTINIEALVGAYDALVILDRCCVRTDPAG